MRFPGKIHAGSAFDSRICAITVPRSVSQCTHEVRGRSGDAGPDVGTKDEGPRTKDGYPVQSELPRRKPPPSRRMGPIQVTRLVEHAEVRHNLKVPRRKSSSSRLACSRE